MAISKSTPYVRYKKDFTSSLHLGTIHIESEYLDRTQKTTIESIHGMTWHNKVVNENKELNLLSDTQLELTELEKQYWNTGEKCVSVDEIHTLEEVEPNEDGTYTYTVNSMEGEYIEIYDGINNITSTSDGLDGQFEIVYDTTEEDVSGNIALDQVVSQYEITDSGVGAITSAKSTGLTLVNHITEPSKEEVATIQEYEGKHFTIENTVQGNIKSAILKGNTLVNIKGNQVTIGTVGRWCEYLIPTVKPNTRYLITYDLESTASKVAIGFLKKKSEWSNNLEEQGLKGQFILNSGDEPNYFRVGGLPDTVTTVKGLNIIEYQEGMENWDIPYFEGMKSVQMPVLTTVGKNLFDKNKSTSEYYIDSTGNYVTGGSGNFINQTHHINNNRSVSVSYSERIGAAYVRLAEFDKNNNFIRRTMVGDNGNLSFNLNTNTYYIVASVDYNNNYFTDLQIEFSPVATSYEPFKSNILTVNEEVELRGIGDVKDELNCLTSEYVQRIGEIVLDGSEDWKIFNDKTNPDDYTNSYRTFFVVSRQSVDIPSKCQLYSDKYKTYTRNPNDTTEKDFIFVGTHNLNVVESPDMTVDEFKNKISLNPITVQYPLATESVKTVDLTVQNQDGGTIPRIQTQQGITHVSTSSDGLIPIVEMSCSYDTIIKPNTTYTIKLDRPNVSDTMYLQIDLGGTMMMLDADVKAFTIKTPNTLSHSQLRLSGTGNTVKEIIVLEGNRVNDKIEYFEGMKNVENPILVVSNYPHVFGKGEGVTFKKYQSTTLSLNEPIQLRSIGDVHDEINYETGEYIQRIGECIYEDDSTPTYNSQIGGYFDSMEVKGKIGLAVADGVGAISDKLINQSFTQHDFGIYGNLNGNLNIFDKTVKNEEEFINKYRGTKFQFILLEPIITKIDTTILDQNNSYKSSQQTYDEQTYISVQSDTVVTPTSSVDYEIYSSTGTVTGTSATIENAEAGTPVSGVVYGETLLNVIQEPSETEYVILGDNFEGQSGTLENTVEGNIKSAILKGNTLVNHKKDSVVISPELSNCYDYTLSGCKSNTNYLVKFSAEHDGDIMVGFVIDNATWSTTEVKWVEPGNITVIVNSGSTPNYLRIRATSCDNLMIIEYQEGMENWDIPYFEGMKSVQMPVLTTSNEDGTKTNILTTPEEVHLHRIGNVQDELNLETGELTQRISEVVLDGSDDNITYKTYGTNNEGYSVFQCTISKSIYGERKFNGKWMSTFPKGSRQASDWKDKEYVGGDWYSATNMSNTFVIKLLTSSMSSDDINGFKEYLQHNPITIQYELETKSIKTISTTIIDQDDKPTDNLHTFDTTTHINTYAQGGGLIPFVNIPETISYNTLLKANTQYTIKLNRTNIVEGTPLTVNLGGTELSIEDGADSFTITTPSTLTNNTLSIGGANNKVKEVMVIEGDCVNRDLDFFEGFISVENPTIYTVGKNKCFVNDFPKLYPKYFELREGRVYGKAEYSWESTGIHMAFNFKQNTSYTISYDKEEIVEPNGGWSHNVVCMYTDGTKKSRYLSDKAGIITDGNKTIDAIYLCNPWKVGGYIDNIQIEEGTTRTSYEPYQSNILTTYPQVTLRSIGDIKDEWDVVGETVTRRIGEVVLDGSETGVEMFAGSNSSGQTMIFKIPTLMNTKTDATTCLCDKITPFYGNIWNVAERQDLECIKVQDSIILSILKTKADTIDKLHEYFSKNPITIYCELATPITESVRITPPNPQTSTASITIPTQLNHVEDTSDFLVWNPYKEHYVRYNYVEDGVVLDNYTWENLTDLNERQFVEFYNKRTYIDQPYHNYVASHDSKGTSKYVLIEPNQDYTVSVRFSELPTCETVKVNLGGAEVEMNVNDPHVHITTPNTLANNLCSISGDGLDGKVTDILVIHCLEHEGFADIDYFEGIDGIGEVVEVDGVPKSKIVMEQTNGNLIDKEFEVWNNGQSIRMSDNERLPVHPNTKYIVKFRRDMDKELAYTIYVQLFNKDNVQTRIINGEATNESNTREFTTNHDETMVRLYTSQLTNNGSTHRHYDIDLCYANMSKDYIRPRWYDKEEILLPIQLHRINTVYDNFYYDEMKGYYRIQQSIGHKYFVGADSENWTLIERGQRVLRFRYNNADIQMKSLGEYMTNLLPNGTATSPYESCTFNGTTFIVSLDIERFKIISLEQFKLWLSEHPLHLYYQLMTPIMVDLPQYNKRIEFNTYKDEIYTFFKNCKPTVFTLGIPLDKTYRFYEYEESQGYANRVELTDERMTDEDTLYIDTIHGSGFSNLIENPNNVETLLKPNYQGKAVSHTLTNGKVSSIKVHGFEPNETTIANYNSTLKQYELIVQAQKGQNINTQTLAVPYKLEVYEDGTKDKVYYDEQNKVFRFEGGSVTNPPYNNSYIFNTPLEVFKGIAPRTGLIAEIKVKFNSGTTSARIYYSLDGGATTAYSTLRSMTDEVEYYIGFFNTGGTKLDYATKLSAEAEYINLAPLSSTLPESLIITQIQNISECTFTLDKTYYFDSWIKPLELDVYNGETIITEQSGAIVIINNNGLHKDALTYTDETYTVYWTYVGGEGNVTITLGGTKVEVVGTQGYATLKTAIDGVQDGLIIGGYNLSIKDLMLVKGERIEDLAYFEGSRAVGTAFVDEDGETKYKITLVTGSELINDKFENRITFEDNNKHNVVVTKLLGNKPNKK